MIDEQGSEPRGEIVLYETEDGRSKVECRFVDNTIWLSQAVIAELFQTTPQNITTHLKGIYRDGELSFEATCKDYLQVRIEGGRTRKRMIRHYNLDAILAVGYRVRSPRGTQFRSWATERLREYLVKGFVMDDERLKNPPAVDSGIPDHFGELLERIRDIRASEQRMYLRVREIFALAADYRPSAEETRSFFRIIQNKLHRAITGMTAAELIKRRADHQLPHMGLTSWKSGNVRKSDVIVAKNYLNSDEISGLNRIVSMWLDFAEDQSQRRRDIFLKDWEKRLDDFLRFNDRDVLIGYGEISHDEAVQHAEREYDEFARQRRIMLEEQGAADSLEVLEDIARRKIPMQ